jgi:two-component system sensor histidine kinase HydH
MKNKLFQFVSPLLFAGVLLILLPIFTFMTLDRLEKQKDFSSQRLLEKGTSLIRTFEAGTRTGMFTMRWGAQIIQTMLYETSLQPEVEYIMIISRDGHILAHSDASLVGQAFGNLPEYETMNKDTSLFYHRLNPQKKDVEVFEVYKRFTPIKSKFRRGRMRMHGMQMGMDHARSSQAGSSQAGSSQAGPNAQSDAKSKDWSRFYLQNRDANLSGMTEHYIFAGLSMKKERQARDILLKETIWRGVLFFILGCVGMFALFVFQAYRSARVSLKHVKAFSDNVIHNMPSGLVTMNTEDEITSINKAARDILGRKLNSPLPQMLGLIGEMKMSKDIINRKISVAVGRTKDTDHKVRLDITASPIKGNENEVMGYLFLFRDLTQIMELEKQVLTNKHLAAIGKLAAGVAHEIRNPLSSIKGFATYFGKRYEDDASDKETAQIMVKEVERINRSITQLLEFAKPMDVEKKRVDIDQMINHSLKLVSHDLETKNIETKVDIQTKRVHIETDGDRMNQVLLNLYINAIEALDNKGMLQIDVLDVANKDRIEIRIKDNGSGMDKDTLDLIFDPYFTTRATGTGLGLSIVHRIVENLEGNIRVESSKETGTCFIINLPVS